MDTKTLVVGQDVYMLGGVYMNMGKVVKVTPSGVDVLVFKLPWKMRVVDEQMLIRFDNDGKECSRSYEKLGFPEWVPEGWELDDMPFAERTALMEQAARDYEARRSEANRRPPR
jgi:hypothetical protein